MMQKRLAARKLLLTILLATCGISIVASSTSRERRHVGAEEAVHRGGRTLAGSSNSFKSSTGRENEITTEVGRKVSHRLIGGHLRATDTKQEAFWDEDILLSSSGNGKEGKAGRKDEDDEKKTLSQQVKEGKYGLIQNEIYATGSPKRPGIISYLGNPEVPKDTIENLGGLDEEEIWLAENHVLVLRGGKFPGHEATRTSAGDIVQHTWPPIDDYKAPRRQVKIPSKPKVPPPFPVQLSEGGPIQIIGPNGTKEVGPNGTVDYGKDSFLTKGLLSEDDPFFTVFSNGSVVSMPDSRNASSEEGNLSGKEKLPDALPPASFPPFYHAIPPGAVFVPPPANNQSDYDEEDQSVYYPPPYSFHYQQDNATAVPPGPLVPGIILPPPPDFFSALEDKKTTTKKYTQKRPETTPLPRPRPTYLPPRKLTTKQYKSTTPTATPTAKQGSASLGVTKVFGRITSRKNLTVGTRSAARVKLGTVPYVEVTTSAPDKSTTLENPQELYNVGPLGENQVTSRESARKNEAWSGVVTGKTIPIMAYYATSTQSTLERPVEVTPASIKSIITTTGNPQRSHNGQASYYFYEESNDEQPPLRTTPPNPVYYETTTESPFFETRPREGKKKQYYRVETVASKDYNGIGFIGSPAKNSGPIRYSESTIAQSSSKYSGSSSARAHGQRMLPDRAPLYYQTVPARPPVQPSYSYTTSKPPQAYYRQEAKPKPIYQYSFEAADYSKRSGNQRQQVNAAYRNDYQNIRIGGDYNNGPRYDEPEKRIRTEVYKNQHPIFQSSTTAHSVISTTENPQQAYYTRHEEKLLDDVTKEYFTIFGKKIGKNIPSTTPLYSNKLKSVAETPSYNGYAENFNSPEPPVYKIPNVKVHYGDQSQKPYSLKEDILVNERHPLPPINPDSEFITVVDHRQPPNYGIHTDNNQSGDDRPLAAIRVYPSQPLVNQRIGPPNNNYVPVVESPEELDDVAYPQLPISLEDDIKVNYRDPRPTINPDAELINLEDDIKVNYRDPRPTLNPDAEFIEPIPARENQPEKPKAYFAYRLPGDGGHFYFLTPQAITQRPDHSAGHLYSRVGTRLPRRRRRPGNA